MKPTRDILTVTEMKTGAPRLLARLNEERRPVLITQDGKPRAVMLDVETYEDLQASLGLLKLIAQSKDDFRKGRWHRHEDVVRDLKRSLKARGRRQA